MQSLMSYIGGQTAPSLVAAETQWQDAGHWDASSLKHPDIVADRWPIAFNTD